MSTLVHLGREEPTERELFFASASDFAALPDSFQLSGKYFVAFLAVDASAIEANAITKLAEQLLQSGCVYFCAWGPDCERVHDLFDSMCSFTEPVIMTTWHEKDSLDEALWFFLTTAWPDDAYSDNCKSSLAIVVGNSDLETQILQKLSNRQMLKNAALREN
jgi:hypothetical protein